MEKTILYQSCNINYIISGKGPALMLIHGFTEDHHIWDDFRNLLAQYFTVITPALPAHGGSDFPTQGLSMEWMSDCLVEILKNENIDEAVMVGHSMGGYVMLNLAERHHQYCKSLCLFHSSAKADTDEIKTNRERAIEVIKNNHSNFLHTFITDLFAESHRDKLHTEISKLISTACEIPAEGLIACMNAMKNRESSLDFLCTTQKPVGFIIGKLDSRVPFDAVLAQSALPQQSHVLILGDCGHMGYLEKPDETLGFIKYFANLSHH